MGIGLLWKVWVAAAVGLPVVAAHAATMWNEATNGDLSNNGQAPTPVIMTVGSNRVLGATGNSGPGMDLDHFTFTVPPGAVLNSIVLLDNTTVSGGASFFGIAAGPKISAEILLSFLHYGPDQIGANLLPALGVGPLGSGTYSVWVQETGGPVKYGFDFVTAPSATVRTLPEWGSILLAALLGLTLWSRRKQSNVDRALREDADRSTDRPVGSNAPDRIERRHSRDGESRLVDDRAIDRIRDGNHEQLTELDADVEGQQRDQKVILRQADFFQRASEAEPVYEAEQKCDQRGPAA